jgi:glycerophosphoryl diester phosphodiesterase
MFSDRLPRGESPLIIGHRGASAYSPENSTAAFELAIRQGADAVECDVRCSADGELLVHHDAFVSGAVLPVSEMSAEDAFQAASAAGYEIPSLEDVLRLCAERIAVNIELKEAGFEKNVVALARRFIESDKLLFTSFNDSTVRACGDHASDITTGLLLESADAPNLLRRKQGLSLKYRLAACNADCVLPHWTLLRYGFSRLLHNLDLPIVVWTVDRPALARLLHRKGISGIITNRPDLIKRAFDDQPSY